MWDNLSTSKNDQSHEGRTNFDGSEQGNILPGQAVGSFIIGNLTTKWEWMGNRYKFPTCKDMEARWSSLC
jgi:hypothetical protein